MRTLAHGALPSPSIALGVDSRRRMSPPWAYSSLCPVLATRANLRNLV